MEEISGEVVTIFFRKHQPAPGLVPVSESEPHHMICTGYIQAIMGDSLTHSGEVRERFSVEVTLIGVLRLNRTLLSALYIMLTPAF